MFPGSDHSLNIDLLRAPLPWWPPGQLYKAQPWNKGPSLNFHCILSAMSHTIHFSGNVVICLGPEQPTEPNIYQNPTPNVSQSESHYSAENPSRTVGGMRSALDLYMLLMSLASTTEIDTTSEVSFPGDSRTFCESIQGQSKVDFKIQAWILSSCRKPYHQVPPLCSLLL